MFLLNNQLVAPGVFPNEYWKVVVGSGIGFFRCSSELADAACLHACVCCAAWHYYQTLHT
jgi:hypothetical protein